MTEKIAQMEVVYKINDREYTEGAKRAEKATDTLDQKTKELSDDMQKAGQSADQAGQKMGKAGQSAASAASDFSKLKSQLSGVSSAIGSIAALGFGGATIGAGITAAMNAAASQSSVLQQFALAAGGDKTMFDAIDKLYSDINRGTPLKNEEVGGIAAQIAKKFGSLDESGQRELASRVIAAGEMGEDTTLILKSLEKIAKTNHVGSPDVITLMDQIAGTSSQTGGGIAATAASLAALAPAADKNYISMQTLQQLMIGASQKYGDDMPEAAARIAEGIANINPASYAQKSDQVRQSVFGDKMKSANMPNVSEWDISGDALYPDDSARFNRGGEVLGKNFWNAMGAAFNDIRNGIARVPANADKLFSYNQAEMERSSVTVNQFFTGADSPTAASSRWDEYASVRWAKK